MKNKSHIFRVLSATVIAACILAFAIFTLAHRVSAASFSPSQISDLTNGSSDFSSKIGEELSELFDKTFN